MARNESYFIQNFASDFGTYDVSRDETFHPECRTSQPHHALTETQYFGFCIPEHNIHAFLYLWHHPNLGVVSAGPLVFQGKKAISLACELIDYRQYIPDSQLGGGYTKFELESSYAVTMVEPGRKFHLRYNDPARQNSYDLMFTGVSAPMVWSTSRHFEQVMRVEGDLSLRGKRYRVDGFNIRDRSWGEARLEDPVPGPPAVWTTGTFDADFAFNVTSLNHPDLNPIWKSRFSIDPEKTLKFGWLIVDGAPVAAKSVRAVTHYDRATLMADRMEMEVTDMRGRVFNIKGTVVAAAPLNTWLNLRVPICLTRWECNGRVGWGDIQEAQWTDFLQTFHPSQG